jgi:hypothetical protein
MTLPAERAGVIVPLYIITEVRGIAVDRRREAAVEGL